MAAGPRCRSVRRAQPGSPYASIRSGEGVGWSWARPADPAYGQARGAAKACGYHGGWPGGCARPVVDQSEPTIGSRSVAWDGPRRYEGYGLANEVSAFGAHRTWKKRKETRFASRSNPTLSRAAGARPEPDRVRE